MEPMLPHCSVVMKQLGDDESAQAKENSARIRAKRGENAAGTQGRTARSCRVARQDHERRNTGAATVRQARRGDVRVDRPQGHAAQSYGCGDVATIG